MQNCAAPVVLVRVERQDSWSCSQQGWSHSTEWQKGSKTAWVASQMGARAGKYQPMGSQSMGWGNRRQAAEVSTAVPPVHLEEPGT